MITSVRLQKFRGFDDATIPLTRVTMLTGPNGIGKTSALEGLYCLFSETRLDVAPLCRYDRTVGSSQWKTMTLPEYAHKFTDYEIFWEECLAFDGRSCSVSAESDDGASRMWTCTISRMSELDDTLHSEAERISAANSTSKFAVYSWNLHRMNGNGEPIELKMTRAQFLEQYVNLRVFPNGRDIIPSACCYVDFAAVPMSLMDLDIAYSRELAQAIRLIDRRITDVRMTGRRRGISVVIDGSREISLGALGTGAVAWSGTLTKMFDIVNAHKRDGLASDQSIPVFVLIDEVGAGVYHSAMDDIWTYFRRFADEHPHVQFVMTSHSDDCVRAFCNAFSDGGDTASVVTMHRTYDGEFGVIQLTHPYFEEVISGEWEVR